MSGPLHRWSGRRTAEGPPPPEKALRVEKDGAAIRLTDRGRTVAEARPAVLDLEIPAPPTPDEARAASRAYRGFARHWFTSCFVCGPERTAGRGLHIFAMDLVVDFDYAGDHLGIIRVQRSGIPHAR